MQPATLVRTVEPLRRATAAGEPLRRPAAIEAEIAAALELSGAEVRARAAAEPETEKAMSSECIVHLIRQDLRAGSGQLAETLLPPLLRRCEANLCGTIRGFPAASAFEIREEVLGRLAVSLLEPGDEADFFEVRFALALKRLRIDACRRQRRRDRGRVVIEAPAGSDDDAPVLDQHAPEPARQETRLLIRQALAYLDDSEREVLVLHRLAGVPLCAPASRAADLVTLLGLSERTLRNRLRAAEAKLRTFAEGEG